MMDDEWDMIQSMGRMDCTICKASSRLRNIRCDNEIVAFSRLSRDM